MEEFCKLCNLLSVFKLSLYEGNPNQLILHKLAAYFVPALIFERLIYLDSKKIKSSDNIDNIWTNIKVLIKNFIKSFHKKQRTVIYDIHI